MTTSPNGTTQRERAEALQELLAERILVLDGATGTWIQAQNLTAADFGGPELEGCNENLVLTRPDVIRRHARGLLRGRRRHGRDRHVRRHAARARGVRPRRPGDRAQPARGARSRARRRPRLSTPGRPRFVAGSMGPTTKAITVTGGVTFDEMIVHYRTQAIGLLAGGADFLLLETAQDTRNLKAGPDRRRAGVRRGRLADAAHGLGHDRADGHDARGQDVEALLRLDHARAAALGRAQLRDRSRVHDRPHPDALGAREDARRPATRTPACRTPTASTPRRRSRSRATLARFMDEGWLNIVGGCCGTTPAHIRALAAAAEGRKPRAPGDPRRRRSSRASRRSRSTSTTARSSSASAPTSSAAASSSASSPRASSRPPPRSRARRSRTARRSSTSASRTRTATRSADVNAFLERATKMVKVPLMLDSTDAQGPRARPQVEPGQVDPQLDQPRGRRGALRDGRAARAALRRRARRRHDRRGSRARHGRHAAAQARGRAAQLHAPDREVRVPAEDILFDPLVFPCGTGDAKYVGSAVETIEGIRLIKARVPASRKTILGISNVSLRPAGGRPRGAELGLPLPLRRRRASTSRSSTPRRSCATRRSRTRRSAWPRTCSTTAARIPSPRSRPTSRAKGSAPKVKAERAGTPLERLPRYILEGSKEGLVEDLEAVRTGGDGARSTSSTAR